MPEPAARYFVYLPVGLFAAVMGLSGLSVAWTKAADTFDMPGVIGDSIAVVAIATFILMATAYGTKAVSAFDVVRAEFRDPIAGNLFGTILVSLLLVAVILAPAFRQAALVVWGVGALGMFAFAWLMVDRWMSDRQSVTKATPAWVVPVVGLLNVPLAIPFLNLPVVRPLMIAPLAIGLFFALATFVIIFARLLFDEPLSPALQPMLLVLAAPFAVGFSAYTTTTGQIDLFAEGLFSLMVFVTLVLLGRVLRAPRSCPFQVTWWAVSFPLAACATASIRYADARPGPLATGIALAFLMLASSAVVGLGVRTVLGIMRGELKALPRPPA